MYTSDKWVIIHIEKTNAYKVLAGWQGGYLDSDYWRLNSGIKAEHVIVKKDEYTVNGPTGSTYALGKNKEGLTSLTSNLLDHFNKEHNVTVVSMEDFLEKAVLC